MLRDAGLANGRATSIDTRSITGVLRASSGRRAMPHQSDILTDQEMSDIATYVVEAAGK